WAPRGTLASSSPAERVHPGRPDSPAGRPVVAVWADPASSEDRVPLPHRLSSQAVLRQAVRVDRVLAALAVVVAAVVPEAEGAAAKHRLLVVARVVQGALALKCRTSKSSWGPERRL